MNMNETTKQDLQWFKDREMTDIVMIREGKKVDAFIKDEDEAVYYFNLQEKGILFEDKIRIHRAPPTGCSSCEG